MELGICTFVQVKYITMQNQLLCIAEVEKEFKFQ